MLFLLFSRTNQNFSKASETKLPTKSTCKKWKCWKHQFWSYWGRINSPLMHRFIMKPSGITPLLQKAPALGSTQKGEEWNKWYSQNFWMLGFLTSEKNSLITVFVQNAHIHTQTQITPVSKAVQIKEKDSSPKQRLPLQDLLSITNIPHSPPLVTKRKQNQLHRSCSQTSDI